MGFVTSQTAPSVMDTIQVEIWKGRLKDDQLVCLKVLRIYTGSFDEKKLMKQLGNEVLIWRQLRHSNIHQFLGVASELFQPSYCIISPWMANGNLMSYCRDHNSSFDTKVTMIREMCEGLRYLHEHNPPIVHSDIKGMNILVSDDGYCRISDFWLCTIEDDSPAGRVSESTSQAAMRGSVPWLAPELMNLDCIEAPNRTTRDIYALGCTMYELLSGTPPFSDQKADPRIILSVLKGIRPVQPTECPDWLWTVIEKCWREEPSLRLTASEVAAYIAKTGSSSFSSAMNVQEAEQLHSGTEKMQDRSNAAPSYHSAPANRNICEVDSFNERETPVKRQRQLDAIEINEAPPSKRGRGRPKGQKNKNPKLGSSNDPAIAVADGSLILTPKRKRTRPPKEYKEPTRGDPRARSSVQIYDAMTPPESRITSIRGMWDDIALQEAWRSFRTTTTKCQQTVQIVAAAATTPIVDKDHNEDNEEEVEEVEEVAVAGDAVVVGVVEEPQAQAPLPTTKLNLPGIKQIRFGEDFDIRDAHLQTMSSIPTLMSTLQVLSLGDSDTGKGAWLTDAGVQSFLSQAPNLISLTLDACRDLTDATLIHALESCPRLQLLQITGNDKVQGKITDSVFRTIRERQNIGVNLRELVLYDQPVSPYSKDFKDLSNARKDLTVREGETLGDGIAANMIAAMSGGAMTTAWKNGEMVGIDTDMGFYGPGGYDVPFDDFF
ncbi:Homeobox protein tos8 [Marasmius tenuissimus]|uniref:Homeobox protein tos8 n=1 Tax=Marasmius tenuissimus TaxID=585030 RepID=A0ABR2ZDW8_9AGAR